MSLQLKRNERRIYLFKAHILYMMKEYTRQHKHPQKNLPKIPYSDGAVHNCTFTQNFKRR